jgi:glucosamine--fructose-6-phosphate aminotransferase (isomerizing)
MCGIVGAIGNKNIKSFIINGLKKLEYRGYDSAGMGTIQNKDFLLIKKEGKILNLESELNKYEIDSDIVIGHTRWATHGIANKENAHPHCSKKVCLVHNGIIENFQEIKDKLEGEGVNFLSQTDTEVIPYLLEQNIINNNDDIIKSIADLSLQIKGTYALAIILKDHNDFIIATKKGSPLVIGIGENNNFIASDYYAISSYTNKIITLEDNEFAFVYRDKVIVYNDNKQIINKKIKIMDSENVNISKEGYDHFMLKEIYEQPRVIEEILQTYVNFSDYSIHLPNFNFDLKTINKITIVACGTSYYSGLIAKYIIEKIAKVEVEVDISSEFRYRDFLFKNDNLMIFISQSGETADTLAALKYSKENKQKTLCLVNAPHSTMAQLSDSVIRTIAGPEIGVASTKAYIAQVVNLMIFAIHLASLKNKISYEEKSKLLLEISESVSKINLILSSESINSIKKIANYLSTKNNVLYIGRGISQVTAFEASLKLKEVSYINAQGISAGELKHGTIALVDNNLAVLVIAPNIKENSLFEKTLSNSQEVNARGGKIIPITDISSFQSFSGIAFDKIIIPEIKGHLQEAILSAIPTQLIAYYVALFKGNDVDQPRNLAKSVTVE